VPWAHMELGGHCVGVGLPASPALLACCVGLPGVRTRAWLPLGLAVWVCLLPRSRCSELPLLGVLLHAVEEICLCTTPVLPPVPKFWEPLQKIHNLGLASCSSGEHPELMAHLRGAEAALI